MALKRRSKVNAEFSMSSLTDIIFLLLIFFMLTSTLVSQNALNLKLPSSNSKTVAPPSMSVSIKKNGSYYLNGQQMSLGNIENGLRQKVNQEQNRDNVTISIFAEENTPIQYVVNVMDLSNRLRVKAILATEPK
ncbi:MAG TPA: biopolymer transporter ExbD [Saprospiraceae bacterium]|nr:biopolymer transporter ExbD [Saprospiraceae bacterium]